MKKFMLLPLSFAFALAVAGLSGSAAAADQAQDAYREYAQKAAAIEEQLFAKEAELDALYAAAKPDTAKAQQLFKEIGELRGQLFAAEAELRAQAGNDGAPYGGGMHHRGEFGRGGNGYGCGYGYRQHRGGYNGGSMGRHGCW